MQRNSIAKRWSQTSNAVSQHLQQHRVRKGIQNISINVPSVAPIHKNNFFLTCLAAEPAIS
jgi:hypothetical protein